MELQEALSIAIEYEQSVRDHYAQCARGTADPKGQRVFATLAREEQGHVEYLQARLQELRSTGVINALELPTVLPAIAWIEAVARKAAAEPGPGPIGQGLPELEYLKQALELELKTSAFYRDMVGLLESGHRGLFARFLEIEDGHVTIVQAEIDALAGHGHWFDFMEFNLEGQ
jgi:rubrerythrin